VLWKDKVTQCDKTKVLGWMVSQWLFLYTVDFRLCNKWQGNVVLSQHSIAKQSCKWITGSSILGRVVTGHCITPSVGPNRSYHPDTHSRNFYKKLGQLSFVELMQLSFVILMQVPGQICVEHSCILLSTRKLFYRKTCERQQSNVQHSWASQTVQVSRKVSRACVMSISPIKSSRCMHSTTGLGQDKDLQVGSGHNLWHSFIRR